MATALLCVIARAVLAARPAEAADRPLDVGNLPFDVVNISGASKQTSDSLAKLVRVEMIRNQKLRPKLTRRAGKVKPRPQP